MSFDDSFYFFLSQGLAGFDAGVENPLLPVFPFCEGLDETLKLNFINVFIKRDNLKHVKTKRWPLGCSRGFAGPGVPLDAHGLGRFSLGKWLRDEAGCAL